MVPVPVLPGVPAVFLAGVVAPVLPVFVPGLPAVVPDLAPGVDEWVPVDGRLVEGRGAGALAWGALGFGAGGDDFF